VTTARETTQLEATPAVQEYGLPAGTTTWSIDSSHSHVEFAVRHMMIATAKGRFGQVEGTLVIDPANPSGWSVDVRIPAESIDTREPKRDAHLRSADFLDAENHPYLTFRSTQVEADGGDLTVYGDLSIRGVTRLVELRGEFLGTNRSPFGFTIAGFSASTKINRKDYGLNWNAALETGGVLVGDDVKISLEVEAIQQQAPAAAAA
jgi:polyisoprenoid-binding protein YceI